MRLDAEEVGLGLEVVAHVLATVIVAECQTVGNALGEGAEALAHRLPDRLQSLETIGAAAGLCRRLQPAVPSETGSSARPDDGWSDAFDSSSDALTAMKHRGSGPRRS